MKHPLLLILVVPGIALSQVGDSSLIKPVDKFRYGLLNINNMRFWVRNDGANAKDPYDRKWGLLFPGRYEAGLGYSDGLVWVGQVHDEQSQSSDPIECIRTGGGIYTRGTLPGSILPDGTTEDWQSDAVRVFRARRSIEDVDFYAEASEVLNIDQASVTAEQADLMKAQYEKDLKEWPWQKGAPFEDENGNGVMDEEEKPGIARSDQVLWYVSNDKTENIAASFYNSTPIGIEDQVTVWGYGSVGGLENVVFVRHRLTYKGTTSSYIDSMYVGQWADADIGEARDDFSGCDSALSLGFIYNAYDQRSRPYGRLQVMPAIGYTILQGPSVVADQNGGLAKRNLPATSFAPFIGGSPWSEGNPSGPAQYLWWNALQGFFPFPGLISYRLWNMYNTSPTRFPFSGDPESRTGLSWVTVGSFYEPTPSDHRFTINAGPFSMTAGDTQEIVIGIVAAVGKNNLNAVTELKAKVRMLHEVYPVLPEVVSSQRAYLPPPQDKSPKSFRLYQNYPNPFNPSTTIEYEIGTSADVRSSIVDLLGRQIRVLENDSKPAGFYSVEWDGYDAAGKPVPSGVYFFHLRANHVQLHRKMMIVR